MTKLSLQKNFEYLTKQETKPEPLVELDETTRQKIQELLKDSDADANILWIVVS